ncbi:MAG: hypothetical protein LBG73_10750, partial [Spirochaetaceae bacterium]|nr:hypothetical protein [Spirochaetaceae bacterium]
WASESGHALGNEYQESNSVFVIPDTLSGGVGTFIKIIGKTDAAAIAPVLRGSDANKRRVLYLAGADTTVRLENIEITGGNSGSAVGGGGIYIGTGGEVILGAGAKIVANRCEGVVTDTVHDANAVKAGGGILVNGGRLALSAGAEIAGNRTPYSVSSAGPNGAGGGAAIIRGGVIEMTGGVIGESLGGSIPGNAVYGGANTGYGGGVAVWTAGNFEMTGGVIRRNSLQSNGDQRAGGGGVWVAGTFKMSGTARIVENANTTNHNGGGVKVYGGTFSVTALAGSGLEITGNTRQSVANNVHKYSGVFILNGTSYANGLYGPFGPY